MKNDYVIERAKTNNCNRTYNTIVAGFPGVGKSTAAEKYPDKYVDMESSDYHWIYTPDGERSVDPKWPNNYVDAIIKEELLIWLTHLKGLSLKRSYVSLLIKKF